jgi:serine protease Do
LKALGAKEGVVVGNVTKDGPADKAGIKEDDIIVALNGKPVKGGDDLVTRISESPIGSEAGITVDRGGKKMNFAVKILDRSEVFKNDPRFAGLQPQNEEPESKPDATAQAKFGIKIRALQDSERDGTGLANKKGVVVTGVIPNSFAEDIRLLEKDVIVSINRQQVTSVEDVRRIQGTLKPGDPVAFRVLRRINLGPAGPSSEWTSFFLSGALPVE